MILAESWLIFALEVNPKFVGKTEKPAICTHRYTSHIFIGIKMNVHSQPH